MSKRATSWPWVALAVLTTAPLAAHAEDRPATLPAALAPDSAPAVVQPGPGVDATAPVIAVPANRNLVLHIVLGTTAGALLTAGVALIIKFAVATRPRMEWSAHYGGGTTRYPPTHAY